MKSLSHGAPEISTRATLIRPIPPATLPPSAPMTPDSMRRFLARKKSNGAVVMTSQMWYNIPVTQSGTGRFLFSADGSIAYCYWVKHPVLLDLRPADCVTTSASNTGCFAMSAKDGKPCKKCGGTEWYKNRECLFCKRERTQRWAKNNPEREAKRVRDWFSSNPDRARENARKRYAADPSKDKEKSDRWKRKNTQRVKDNGRRWRQENPEKENARTHRRRSRIKGGGGSYTAQEWLDLCNQYGNRCLACGRGDVPLAADHIKPVSLGGSSDISNIQPLCKSCNSQKHNRYIDYRDKPGLLRWVQRKLFED